MKKFPEKKYPDEIIISGMDIKDGLNPCDGNDQLLILDAHVFNFSGNITLGVEINKSWHLFGFDNSVFISKISYDEYEDKVRANFAAVLCLGKTWDLHLYLGILTTICNSISLTLLFIVICAYIISKSVRFTMVLTIPHLSVSLFFAQFMLQVRIFIIAWQHKYLSFYFPIIAAFG